MYLRHTMQELNENVTGNYVEEDPVALLDAKPDFFRIFTLVIATQVFPTQNAGHRRRLSAGCSSALREDCIHIFETHGIATACMCRCGRRSCCGWRL